MGIGMNFVCKCCDYDTGILMLHQGSQDSIQEVIKKYIYTYSQEIDLIMHPKRLSEYKQILNGIGLKEKETTYQYEACVCYSCKKTFERLDIQKKKEKEVYAGDKGRALTSENPIRHMFQLSEESWSSMLGDDPQCVFCNQLVVKISEEAMDKGIACPKCHQGNLIAGEEFELWD